VKRSVRSWRTALYIISISLPSFILMAQENRNLIAPSEARSLITEDSTVVLLDVRTQAEFDGPTGHLRDAHLIPVQELERRVGELQQYKDQTIIVYCRTGHRSTWGTSFLRAHGFRAVNMEGGITRWLAENLPVEH
jgi:rhodanese-related sulfurtransferase